MFIAYLNNEHQVYGSTIDHIGQYLEEAKGGLCKIYCSTLTIAEVTKRFMKHTAYGSFTEFLADFSGAITQITPDPHVMSIASQLRSLPYSKNGGKRKLLTPDAIHLASAIALRDTYKVPLTAFHTFDNGKSGGAEGKSVSLLGYHEWCEGLEDNPTATKVISLSRAKPEHPSPKLMI